MASKKEKYIQLRISAVDYKRILQFAQDAGVSVSEYIRRKALKFE